MDKDRFLWGSATAAYQCEGAWSEDGKGMGEWDTFCHSEKNNVNPVTGDVSCDHYHRYEEDIRMMAEGNQNTYRFSIAWSRIIPDGTGAVNQKGIDHYNKVIDTCLNYNIVPNATLFHYDLPDALAKKGGWENRGTVDAYAAYAKACFEAFGDRVPLWTTVNEPSYYTHCAYAAGNYPPNIQNFSRRSRAAYYLLLASARAVAAYHEKKYAGQIGLVHDAYPIETEENDEANRKAGYNAELFFNKWVTDCCLKGFFSDDLIEKLIECDIDLSFREKGDDLIFHKGTVDFLGLNIYDRQYVKPYQGGKTEIRMNNRGKDNKVRAGMRIRNWFETAYDENVQKNEWGMEIYPKCIYNELTEIKRQYGDIPLYITENGVGLYESPDRTGTVQDDARIAYLSGCIDYMLKAKEEGVNVRGYYVWSSLDLYSWINGYEKRYGLVYVDYDNGNGRVPKKSYYWYRDLIEKYSNHNEEE
ncbi:glycoside hydrolase family 1 protein [Caproiciproducens sp.]|uniref:glycoside hydrolase family 1 protein n=1 Tax=Caproiciproducens sp. TaxID=1954376 RepID=UPI00289BCCA9|nr:glycoside hydrolase family 1 protein [Caproiciproducens sp.]